LNFRQMKQMRNRFLGDITSDQDQFPEIL
jgi:hypothetical protein